MSAFIINDETYSLLHAYISRDGFWSYVVKNCNFQGNEADFIQELNRENYNSVNHRYRENDSPEPVKIIKCLPLSMIATYKLIQCIKYQCCEHREWTSSKAFEVLSYIEKEIALDIIGALEEYRFSPWEANQCHISTMGV